MARPKKDEESKDPFARLLARLQQNEDRDISLAADLAKDWRYIDFVDPHTKLPCLSLEWFFGARGILAGRLVKMQATYGVGKSSLMFFVYACAQMMSKAFCYHVESEAAPPPADFIASFGCDPQKLIITQPKSLESAMADIDTLIAEIRGGEGGSVGPDGRQRKTIYTDPIDPDMNCPIVIGVDSISGFGTESKVEEDVCDLTKSSRIAGHAGQLAEYFRDRMLRLKRKQVLMLMAAQEKAFISTGPVQHGGKTKATLGENPIGFHATTVIEMRASRHKDKSGTDIGENITMYTTKNKISPKHRTIQMYLVRDKGFDVVKSDTDFLISHPAMTGLLEANRHAHGITCKALNNASSFKDDLEFLQAFYGNVDYVMAVRDQLRIRGFGFKFETNYMELDDEETPMPEAST